jgi:predicted regulator of Ras-like GTPase activity (Roadblock/LC7/MglB family)
MRAILHTLGTSIVGLRSIEIELPGKEERRAMLTSLFGELGSAPDPFENTIRDPHKPRPPFAASSILESVATEVNDIGQMIDRRQRDLVVTGSAAHAIREHFAATRADMEVASRVITFLDPAGVWAASVIKALADAGGRPIERLQLREQTTLRTLAVIQRTSLVRRSQEALKVYHADVRVPGRDNAEIPVALMERSHLTAVVVGPQEPSAIAAMLQTLQQATLLATWRCPNLVFLLPPNAVWIANKISSAQWPTHMRVQVITESLTNASAVWNTVLARWNDVKDQPGWPQTAVPSMLGLSDFPIRVADLTPPSGSVTSTTTTETVPATPPPVILRPTRSALDPEHARNSLADLLGLEGLLFCAVVDATNGSVVARELREGDDADVDRAAASCAKLLQAHKLSARSLGMNDHVEEVTVGSGSRHQLIRVLSRHPERFIFVLLNKQRANLSLARFKLAELDRALV